MGELAGQIKYGGGIYPQTVKPGKEPVETDIATFIGHEGVTYGFRAQNGYFPQLEASMAILLNVDYLDPTEMLCNIVQQVTIDKGHLDSLLCKETQTPKFSCVKADNGQPMCAPSSDKKAQTYSDCASACFAEAFLQ